MNTFLNGLSSLLGGFRRSVHPVHPVRRGGAAALALVLCASVLVTVAGSPAGAANTAVESLADTDNKAATPPVRAFAGANRYATSLAVAKAFVDSTGVGGFADSVIIASGESLIDAAAAAGLAAAKTAPVLLTPPGRLPRAVASFIVDEFISDVFIVGGTSAVSERVEDALNDLAPVRSVTRLAGEDRYGTAVAVSEEVGDAGLYCDSAQRAAVLVNVDNSFADVISVGPLAYALGLPVLLTGADELPVEVIAYLIDAEIERVVVVGGTSAVSEKAVAEMGEAGVSDVERIAGANRFETAVATLNALKACSTVAVSSATVAFVNASAAADGVSAAPLLGLGLNGDGLTPMLLVTTSAVPAATMAYLAALPTRAKNKTFVNVSLTAIGGTSVIPAAVMDAAVTAATTSEPITATITAEAAAEKFTVKFSDVVNAVAFDSATPSTYSSVLNPAHYRTPSPLFSVDTLEYASAERLLTVKLGGDRLGGDRLGNGNVVSVVGNAIQGVNGDQRFLQAVSATAAPRPVDRVRPRVRVIAVAGAHEFAVETDEVSDKVGEMVAKEEIQLRGAALPADADVYFEKETERTVVCLYGTVDAVADDVRDVGALLSPDRMLKTALTDWIGDQLRHNFIDSGVFWQSCETAPLTGESQVLIPLVAGDSIVVKAGAILDSSNNESRTVNARVASASDHPRVVKATVTSPTTPVIAEATTDMKKRYNMANTRWILSEANIGYETLIETAKFANSSVAVADGPVKVADGFVNVYTLRDAPWLTGDAAGCLTTGTGTPGLRLNLRRDDDTSNLGPLTNPMAPGPIVQTPVSSVVTTTENPPPCTDVDRFRDGSDNVVRTTDPDGTVTTVRTRDVFYTAAEAMELGEPVGGRPKRREQTRFRTTSRGCPTDSPYLGGHIPTATYQPHEEGSVSMGFTEHSPLLYAAPNLDLYVCYNNDTTMEQFIKYINEDRLEVDPSYGIGTQSLISTNYYATPSDINHLVIEAKPDGIAGGGKGNDWYVELQRIADDNSTPTVNVHVISGRKTLFITFDDDATPADIVEALNSDALFTKDFIVEMDLDDPLADKPEITLNWVPVNIRQLKTGLSEVTVTFQFSDVLSDYNQGKFIDSRPFRPENSRPFTPGNGWLLANPGYNYDAVNGEYVPKTAHDDLSERNTRLMRFEGTVGLGDLTKEIGFRIQHENAAFLPKPGDTITLPKEVFIGYKTGSEATILPDGTTVKIGQNKPETITLRLAK